MTETVKATAPKRQWRKASVKMDPGQAQRQGAAAKSAFHAFGDRDRVLAFLNQFHPDLDGRPIDVAVASDAGLAAVEQLIAQAAPAQGIAT